MPTVMFVGAHADDMEIRAAGTMRRFVEKGWRAITVMATNNLCGAYPDDTSDDYFCTLPEETQAIRHREAREAADLLGLELIFLDFKENSYWNGERRVFFGQEGYDQFGTIGREPLIVAQYLDHCLGEVAQVLIDTRPDIVITHSVGNCNPEHCATAHITHSAFLRARSHAPLGELWFTCRMQSPSDVLFLSPDVLIDITPYWDLKLQSLELHRSQRLPTHLVRNTDEYWGRVAGCEVAEAFKTIRRVT